MKGKTQMSSVNLEQTLSLLIFEHTCSGEPTYLFGGVKCPLVAHRWCAVFCPPASVSGSLQNGVFANAGGMAGVAQGGTKPVQGLLHCTWPWVETWLGLPLHKCKIEFMYMWIWDK